MNELLLPLPTSVSRVVWTDMAFWSIELPYQHAFIWNHMLVKAIETIVVCLAAIIFRAAIPDPSLSARVMFYLVIIPLLFTIIESLFSADFIVTAHQDFFSVYKMSWLLTSHEQSIGIRSCVEVGLVYVDGTRQIRVFTEASDLCFGEQLTLEEQNCLLAEIKEAYFSLGKDQI
mmetsp:Transcript_10900/g.23370  ORF Transcript_10900/g.23370 Transcript_10900/m.23370 type:complete len:174 (-) Transcript_10900:125-646(-)